MRKGFLHIVEIVIVSLVAFFLFFQFFSIPTQQMDWESVRLWTQANDILFTLDKKGINWFNSTEVQRSLMNLTTANTLYSLKLRNVIVPRIEVGCICNDTETATMSSILQPFVINGQRVDFSINQIDPGFISFPHNNDVVIAFDYNMTNNYTQIYQYLGAGKGLVEIRNLDASEIDLVQQDFFGLKWNSALSLSASQEEFGSKQSSSPYYSIYNIFHSIPLAYDDFSNGDNRWNKVTGTGGWSVNSQNYVGMNTTGDGNESVTIYSQLIDGPYSLSGLFMTEGGLQHNVTFIMYNVTASSVRINLDVDADRVSVSEGSQSRGMKSYTINNGTWYKVDIVTYNQSIKVYLNGILVLASQTLSSIPPSSQIGLDVEYGQARFDNIRVTFARPHNFTGLIANEKIEPVSDSRSSVLIQKDVMRSACIANKYAGVQGRTAWLAPSGSLSTEVQTMLKALVVWAASEEYDIVENSIMNVPVKTAYYKTYDQDMFQPVEIVMTMGYIYK